MRSVVFVAPFFAETTLRFVRAAAELDGVRLGLVSQDPWQQLPAEVAAPLAAHRRIRDGLDPQQIADAVRDLQRELGPVQVLLGALEQLQETLADVRKALGIPGMDRGTALNFRDKARMKATLRAAGVDCARHALAESADEAIEFAKENGLPLVIKPPDGAGARQTMRVETMDDLRDALRMMPPRSGAPILLEEFIVGEEHSFDTVSIGGRHVWHSLTHYRPGPLEVMENPWIQWTVLLPREVDHPRYNDIRAVAAQALDALGMQTGLTHMEWFRRKDGSIAVSEVAARPPGAQFTTLISYAHDVDFYRSWARVVIEEHFEIPRREYAAGIAYLRGQGQGRVQAIHGLERAQLELGSLVAEVRLPRLGQHPAGSYEGEGYVVLRDRQTEKVAQGLVRLVELVQVELGPEVPR
jgi:biotin carboxylase